MSTEIEALMGVLNGDGRGGFGQPAGGGPASGAALAGTGGGQGQVIPSSATPVPLQVPPAQVQPAAQAAQASAAVVTETPKAGASVEESMDDDTKALLGALSGDSHKEVVWEDGVKEKFKTVFGQEPEVFKGEWEKQTTRLKELEVTADEADKLRGLLTRIEKEHPVLAAAIMEASAGKDPLAYIDAIPERKLMGKEAKDITTEVLVNTYLRDRFTDAERKAMRTGDFDDLAITKEDIKAKYELFRSAAELRHEERMNEHRSAHAQREERAKEASRKMSDSITESLARASADPMVRSFITKETIAAAKSGALVDKAIYNEDGTLSPGAIALIVKGQRYDADIKRVYEAGKKARVEQAMLEETHRMPSTVGVAQRGHQGGQQPQQQPIDPGIQDLVMAMAGGR